MTTAALTAAVAAIGEACSRVDIVAYAEKAGIKMVGGRNERRSACPFCEAGATSRSVFRIRVREADFHCFGCGAHGDVVSLHRRLGRYDTEIAAARNLLGGSYEPPKVAEPKVRIAEGDAREARIRELAQALWDAGGKIAGKAAERYLVGARGIDPDVVAAAAGGMRYTPFAKHHWDGETRKWVTAGAIVLQVSTPAGWTGGVHATYLQRDGSGKADFDTAKRMWGPQLDADGRPGAAWLIGPDGDDDLVVGEGLETTLSLAAWLKARGIWPVRIAPALSLGRLQGLPLVDRDGCIDVWKPTPNPDVPAFTWPPPASGGRVFLAIERDMSRIKVRGRTGRGKPVDMWLDAEARAALQARLAGQAWKGAGWRTVKAMWPAPGGDWNDFVQRTGGV